MQNQTTMLTYLFFLWGYQWDGQTHSGSEEDWLLTAQVGERFLFMLPKSF